MAKVKEITLRKNLKIGLPNYSNIDVGMYVTWEIGEKEEFDYDKAWDLINGQLQVQAAAGTDPAWISNKEHKGHYSTTIKTKK